MKKCNKCLIIKSFSEFGIEKRALNGYKPRCKKCTNEYYNSIYKSGKIKKEQSDYYLKNKTSILQKRELYYSKNKSKIINRNKIYLRKRKLENPYLVKLSTFRGLISKMSKNKEYSTFKYLGYSFDELVKSLGKLPDKTEHIDHKIPISWFLESAELKLIFSLENLQILSAKDNISKGNRFSHKISKKYFNKIKTVIKPKYLKQINYE